MQQTLSTIPNPNYTNPKLFTSLAPYLVDHLSVVLDDGYPRLPIELLPLSCCDGESFCDKQVVVVVIFRQR